MRKWLQQMILGMAPAMALAALMFLSFEAGRSAENTRVLTRVNTNQNLQTWCADLLNAAAIECDEE